MGKQELSTHISDNSLNNCRTSNFNNKNRPEKNSNFKQSRSKTSIEYELIYSKKITDIPSRYKNEEITFENSFYMQLEPDIVCYNMETHNDGYLQPSENTVNKKINKPKANPNNPQQPDHSHKNDTDKDKDDNKDINSIKRTKISKTRLLHSRLRPDTSNTSVIELPDIKYTRSTEKLPKLKYPKNVPPPVFKQVGSYKCKIPLMTSKERLLERQRLIKEHQEFEKELRKIKERESILSIDPAQQSKFLKKKENTQYDIVFGKGELEEYMKEHIIEEEPIESRNKMKKAAKKLFKRFQKAPKSESEIVIIDDEPEVVEQPRRPSPIKLSKLSIDDSDSDEIEIEDWEEEPEEEPEELQIEEYFENEPEEEVLAIIPKKESKRKVQKKKSPIRKISSEEVIPNKESSIKLQKKESSMRKMSSEKIISIPKKSSSKEIDLRTQESEEVKVVPKKESSVKAIHTEDVKEKPRSKADVPSSVDECMEQCKYKPLCTAMKTLSKPGIRQPLVIFKKCDKGQDCENLMRSIAIQYKNKPKSVEIIVSDVRALPSTNLRSSRGSSNYNRMEMNGAAVQHSRHGSIQPNSVQQDPRYSIGNSSGKSNRPRSNSRKKSIGNVKKCEYNSKEELYEKELKSFHYVTNYVTQNQQTLKATDHNLLLDLNLQNKITQTRHSQTKRKSNQTMNYFPTNENRSMSVPWRNDSSSNYIYSKNTLHVPKGKDFKVIRTTPMGVPQLLIISHPVRRQSQVPKPRIDIIYQNSKYLACPKYAKAVIPHQDFRRMSPSSNSKYLTSPNYIRSSIPRENSQRISVDNRKYSFNNNNRKSRISAYYVNVPQKSHSLNLKTEERSLSLKLV